MIRDQSRHNVSGEDVQAWIDGELSELEAARVKAAVARDHDLRKLANSLKKQIELMQAIHIPKEKTSSSSSPTKKLQPLARKPFTYAAAVLLGIGIGWLGQDWVQRKTTEARWSREALNIYDFLREDSFWSVDFTPDEKANFEKITEKLYGKTLPIPDLNDRNFAYYGAKVMPEWDGDNLYLIYRDPQQRLVTVTISSGQAIGARFRPRDVRFDNLRFQTRQMGGFGISITTPKDDDTSNFVSARVFSAFR
ncbi:MAG: hypothetical protein RIF37_15475 [Rhodospirillaceae bacterium]